MGDGVTLELVRDEERLAVAQEMFDEFLQWADERIEQEYGVVIEESVRDASLGEASEFAPPSGRLGLKPINP